MQITQNPVGRAERFCSIVSTVVAFAFSSLTLEVSATAIDTTYGDGGFVQLDFYGDASRSFGVVEGNGGELVMAGTSLLDTIPRCAVSKLTADGEPSLDFGVGGTFVSDLGTGEELDSCGAFVVDPEGNLFTVGVTYLFGKAFGSIMVVGLTPTGQLLETFGHHGKVFIDVPATSEHYASALTRDDDGNLYLAGSGRRLNGQFDALVIKLDSTGDLVSSFGERGFAMVDWGGHWDAAVAIALDRFERLVVVGTTDYGAPSDFVASRFTTDGEVDETFGTGGMTTVDIDTYDDTTAMTLDDEDNLYTLVMATRDAPTRDAAVVKLNASGSVAIEFGENGVARSAWGRWAAPGGITFGPKGNLYISGQYWPAELGQSSIVEAIDPTDGTLVTTFGDNGVFLHSFDPMFTPYAHTFDSQGRLYLGGGSSLHFAATRILLATSEAIFANGFEP